MRRIFRGEKNTHSESSANIQKYYERDEYSIDVTANELAANLRVIVDIAGIACRSISSSWSWQCCIRGHFIRAIGLAVLYLSGI